MNVRRLVPLACALPIGLFATLLDAQRGATPPAPARVPQPVAREMAAEYRQLVEQFLHGDAESAVNVIRTWQIASVEAVQDVQPWDRMTLRAAAVFETDAALASARDVVWVGGRPLPPSQSRAYADVSSRLSLAIRWLELADKIKPADESRFRRRWQVALGRLLLWQGLDQLADMILGDAILLFPNDPDVLLAYGTARETAALSVRPGLAWLIGSANGGYGAQRDRGMLLDDARRYLSRASGATPASPETRLRLAHVRILQHDENAARVLLEELKSARPPPPVAYLAALMLGRIKERDGDLKAAAETYQNAQQLLPGSQTAYVAHAQALQASGQLRESIDVLRSMLTRRDHIADPWILYPLGLDEKSTSLDSLRAEIQQQSRPTAAQERAAETTSANAGASFEVPADARQSNDAILLDVLVTRDQRPVSGLTAAAFDVRHDEAPQQVELVSIDTLPVDVRLVVDINGTLDGDRLARVKAAATELVSRVRPADRVQVLSFSDDIRLIEGLTNDRQALAAAIERIAPDGTASRLADFGTSPRHRPVLVDATFTALALPATPGRRTLVLVYATGRDSVSWLSPADVVDVAASSGTIVYAVRAPEPDLVDRDRVLDASRLRGWLYKEPFLLREAFLPVLTDSTGGEVLRAVSVDDLPATFASAVSRFQQRYRLKYSPTVKPISGRHTVEIRMKDRSMHAVARAIISRAREPR
jgi:VWFA-related protein